MQKTTAEPTCAMTSLIEGKRVCTGLRNLFTVTEKSPHIRTVGEALSLEYTLEILPIAVNLSSSSFALLCRRNGTGLAHAKIGLASDVTFKDTVCLTLDS